MLKPVLLLSGAALLTLKSDQGAIPGEPRWLLGKPLQRVIVTEGWGMARDGRACHGGLDLRAAVGTPCFAASSGTVRFAGAYADGSGNAVELMHGDGMMTRYLHLSALGTKSGAQVEAGDQIGQTGFASSPHLHLDVWVLPIQTEAYRRRFGDAKFLGTITQKFGGKVLAKVPGEPLIEADGYQQDVVVAARNFEVRVREGVAVVA